MGMSKCKACGREFASTNPKDEICYPCKNALNRLNGYAVPVVRCKDCKYIVEDYHNSQYICDLWHCRVCGSWDSVKESDFCSYGERKDNETV